MRKARLIPLVMLACAAFLASCASSSDSARIVEPEAQEAERPAPEDPDADAEPAAAPTTKPPENTDDIAGAASTTPSLSVDFPDIIAVQATREDAGTWRFDVTVSSPYDTPERYADAWRVLDPDGNELGIRVLTHDHANEQPFTRSQGGIAIPDNVTEVTVQGRDQANGWGGGELVVPLPSS